MLHVQLTHEEVEKEYPSLEAVDDLDLPDLSRLEDEQPYAAGMRVVQNILREMSGGSGQGLGHQALLKDLGLDVPLRLWTDSSAAIGICSRQGLG